jgi:hypothetical protein
MATLPKSKPVQTGRLPVIEILHTAKHPTERFDENVGHVEDLNGLVKVYVGGKAFRIYEASTGMIGSNRIGTLQGMVKSAKWRTVFRITSDAGEKMEVLAFLAIFAKNVAESADEFEAIWESKESHARKYFHFVRLADTIGKRTAAGAFTAGVSTIYDALKGWCMIGGLFGGGLGLASNQCVSVIEDADFRVKAAGKAAADWSSKSDPMLNTIDIILE